MKLNITHPHYRKQEKKLSLLSFADYPKGLPEVLRGASQKAIDYFWKNFLSHPICFLSVERWAFEAKVSERSVYQALRYLKKLKLIRVRRRWMTTSLYTLGSYFRFFKRETLGHIFPSILKNTAHVAKFSLMSLCIITDINVLISNFIYKKSNREYNFVSNTSNELLRSCKKDFDDPPQRKTSAFSLKGQVNNPILLEHANSRKQKLDGGLTHEELLHKINRHKQNRDGAMLRGETQVIEYSNREIAKLEEMLR